MADTATSFGIGDTVPSFSLTDTEGARHDVPAEQAPPATVLIQTCNHCPYVIAWNPRLRAVAAGLATRSGFVFSHDSAAHLLGLPFLRPRRELVHVTRPGVVGSRHQHGVKHHRAPFLATQVVRAGGWRCLDLARTALDLAREHGYDAGSSG